MLKIASWDFSGHSHSEERPEHRGPRQPVPERVIEALQRSGKKRGEHNAHPGQAKHVHHPEGSRSSHGKGVNRHHQDRRGGRPVPPKRVRQRIARL